MRRSGISMTSIQRLISADNRRKREEHRRQLIESNGNDLKELPPRFEIEDMKFDFETRMAKIKFQETIEYRTVEKYVTQNHVRHPIYSHWKMKHKEINRSIKLTNSTLENLHTNEDSLIQMFSSEIVARLECPDLYPSWFIIDFLTKEYEEAKGKIEEESERYNQEQRDHIYQISNIVEQNTAMLAQKERLCNELAYKGEKLSRKIEWIEKKKPLYSFALTFLTLGICGYLVSSKRRKSLSKKIEELECSLEQLKQEMSQIQEQNEQLSVEIETYNEKIRENEAEAGRLLANECEMFNRSIIEVEPLSTSLDEDGADSFVMMKSIIGMDPTEIMGCYAIRNRENEKVYVGQSKNILRRLKQLFKGTVPQHPAFSEDYYTSSFENKEDLFEVRVVPCSTRDEMDGVEEALVEEYDSRRSGYNKTSGNR